MTDRSAKHPILASFVYALSVAAVLSSCSLAGSQMHRASQTRPPDELLIEAMSYKGAGRIELSRKTLMEVIARDRSGNAGALARRFLRSQLPKKPIPLEAEQRNIIGFNQAGSGDLNTARTTFTNLIRDFPEFEWPYANLALVSLKENKLDEAEQLLAKAVAINQDYANGWSHLARVKHLKGDLKGEQECLRRKEAIDKQ
ncbi:MAG TPA: tetratricopeptide repeat protein [Candidatus Obscuribacterales bacterium]